MSAPAWIGSFLGTIYDGGEELELRGGLNFIGFTLTPLNDETGKPKAWSIEIPGGTTLAEGDYSGQLLQWSGSEWNGIMTLPDAGDTLVWNGSDWVPTPTSTEWQTFTPVVTADTWSQGDGIVEGTWRKSGPDTIEMLVVIRIGSTTSFTGAISVSLPSGWAIDTTKLPSTGAFLPSSGVVQDFSSPASNTGCNAYSNGTTSFILGPFGTGDPIDESTPWTWATNDAIRIHVTIPVVAV